MLRRKAKRQLESSENEGTTTPKHGRPTPSQIGQTDDLEELVFGDQLINFDIEVLFIQVSVDVRLE
jgi:hypothetical protein